MNSITFGLKNFFYSVGRKLNIPQRAAGFHKQVHPAPQLNNSGNLPKVSRKGPFIASIGIIAGAYLYANSKNTQPKPFTYSPEDTGLISQADTQPKPFTYSPEDTGLISQAVAFGTAFNAARKAGTVDDRMTHVPFLAAKIKSNFNTLFPKERVLSPNESRIVGQFRKEMNERIEQRQVTYEWWILFNMRLSILSTPPQHRSHKLALAEKEDYYNLMTIKEGEMLLQNGSWKTHLKTESVLQRYILILLKDKDAFLFPTTAGEGDFSIHQFNEIFATGIFFIGLSNRPMMVDGVLQFPDSFFRHDLFHYHIITKGCERLDKEQLVKMKTKFFEKREEAKDQPDLVQLVDTVFYFMTHDSPIFNISDLVHAFIDKHPLDTYSEFILPSTHDQYYRTDYFKDILPDPAKFECSFMWGYGLDMLGAWLSDQTYKSSFDQKRDNALPKEVMMQSGVLLSLEELLIYNEIVKLVNEGKSNEVKLQISQSQGPLKRVLEDVGITKGFTTP